MPTRRSWTLPILRQLPKLSDLTLASAIGGTGGTGGGGSTVFGLVLAVLSLAVLPSCSSDRSFEPSAPAMPKVMASISCRGDVTTMVVTCGDPVAAPGQEIIGGQGNRVVLRSSGIVWTPTIPGEGDFAFLVTVQNVSPQEIGIGAFGPTGVHVFFENPPVPDAGTITIEDNGIATYTAPNQAVYHYASALASGQTSVPVPWKFHLAGGASSFTFNVLVAADVFDQGGVLRWLSVDGFDQRKYNDVAAHSDSDRMAVGDYGVTARWNGTRWTNIPAVFPDQINSVTTGAPGHYWAATANGRILFYNGNSWTVVHDHGDLGAYYDIWASGDTAVVAVGVDGQISRLSAVTDAWTIEDIATLGGGSLTAVSGTAGGTKVSIVNGGAGVAQVFTSLNDGSWDVDGTYGALVGATAVDIEFDSDGKATFTFIDSGGAAAVYHEHAGFLWVEPAVVTTGLLAIGPKRVAVAFTIFGNTHIMNFDYSGPTPVQSVGASGLGAYFTGMTTPDGAGSSFNVTSPTNKHLYEYDGGAWSDVQGPGSMVDPDLWGKGDTVWMADGSGSFYKFVSGVATSLPGTPGLNRIWGISPTGFVGAAGNQIMYSDGTSGWSAVASLSMPVTDLWAWSPTTWIVASAGGTVDWQYNGVPGGAAFPGTVTAVWGCNSQTAWITTSNGSVYRWTAGVVAGEPTFIFFPPPTSLNAVTGSSCSDVWVAGGAGAAFHFHGGSWTNRSNIGGPLYRAAAIRSSNDQVITAGLQGNGGLFTANGPFNYKAAKIPSQGGDITSLWRTTDGQVYAAGVNILLRGVR